MGSIYFCMRDNILLKPQPRYFYHSASYIYLQWNTDKGSKDQGSFMEKDQRSLPRYNGILIRREDKGSKDQRSEEGLDELDGGSELRPPVCIVACRQLLSVETLDVLHVREKIRRVCLTMSHLLVRCLQPPLIFAHSSDILQLAFRKQQNN